MQVNSEQIKRIRNEIDEIDTQIIQLLTKRFQAVQKIGWIKKKSKIQVTDSQRENFLHNRLEELASRNNLDLSFLTRLWKEILKESYRIQMKSESDE